MEIIITTPAILFLSSAAAAAAATAATAFVAMTTQADELIACCPSSGVSLKGQTREIYWWMEQTRGRPMLSECVDM